jgi:hypothetical protein
MSEKELKETYDKLLKDLISGVNKVVKSAPNANILCNVAGVFIAAATDAMIRAGMNKERVLATMKTIVNAYVPQKGN